MTITLTPLGSFEGGANVADINYAMGETRKLDGIIREIQTASNLAQSKSYSFQATAATLTSQQFMALAAGEISVVMAKAAVAAAAAEDMTVNVLINAVSCLTAVVDLDAAAGIVVQAGVVDTAANSFVAGDTITIVRTYTAGGAPTPMTGTSVTIGYQEAL